MFVFYRFLAFICCLLILKGSLTELQADLNQETGSVLVVQSPINAGFFAIFTTVMGALELYEQNSYAGLKIDLNSGIYIDSERGPNWWNYFFKEINIVNHSEASEYICSVDDTFFLFQIGAALSRERSFELIQKYVHLQPEIEHELNTFIQQQFKNSFMIGVHHRGTDKKTEITLIPYHITLLALNNVISQLPESYKNNFKIYVASDEQSFINYLTTFYPSHVIYNNFVRSLNNQPIHYQSELYSSNYIKGKEALLDCLLLSKCHYLIYPASTLSITARKFNLSLLDLLLILPKNE